MWQEFSTILRPSPFVNAFLSLSAQAHFQSTQTECNLTCLTNFILLFSSPYLINFYVSNEACLTLSLLTHSSLIECFIIPPQPLKLLSSQWLIHIQALNYCTHQ
ncbi:hypothetical protein HMI54_015700 [Coelomomyces lativittatus]|nr:hypothetical protein HMI54_015700 [Coelomomyces lativittatus]